LTRQAAGCELIGSDDLVCPERRARIIPTPVQKPVHATGNAEQRIQSLICVSDRSVGDCHAG
jgi:hypothetical protein